MSLENRAHQLKFDQPVYREFLRAFKENRLSPETRQLAGLVQRRLGLPYHDQDMPIVDKNQAICSGKFLAQVFSPPDIIFVSPYLRAKQTIVALSLAWPHLANAQKLIEPRIREQDYGTAGQYFDRRVFQVFHPNEAVRMSGGDDYRYPHGESFGDVRHRVLNWIEEIGSVYRGAKIMSVGHYGTGRALRDIVRGLNTSENIHAEYCGVSLYEPTMDRWRECFYNIRWY